MTLPPLHLVRRWEPFIKLMMWLFCPVALYLGFYALADWEGAQVLEATKAKWVARGESFDPHSFILPPIPDAQNLATPLLQACQDRTADPYQAFSRLFPDISSIYPSRRPLTRLRHEIDNDYHHQFANGKITDSIKQSDLLYPMYGELKRASQARTQFQINPAPQNGPPSFPFGRLWQITSLGSARASLEIQEHHSDLAAGDLLLCFRILDCANKYAEYRGQPVVIKSITLISEALETGILSHTWSDEQLSIFQNEFAHCDELANWQLTNRGELARIILPDVDACKSDRKHLLNPPYINPNFTFNLPFFYSSWPKGWFDSNAGEMIDSLLNAVQCVDPKSHRVYPIRIDTLINAKTKIYSGRLVRGFEYPWEMVSYYLMDYGYFQAFRKEFPSQALVDEAQITCALERYYLTHHVYPKTLAELVPAYAKTLPNDPFGGAPYKYVLHNDGTYLLYSIGWDEKDDGGMPASEWDPSVGDYVWPTKA